MGSLLDRSAFITGKASPYAELCRVTLAEQGARVMVSDDIADWKGAAAEGVDILVTCPPALGPDDATTTIASAIASCVTPAEQWAERAAAHMRARGGGTIVHITGLAGLGGWPGWQAAGAAYAAVHGMAQSAAVAMASHGLRINVLVPGVDARLGTVIAAHSGRGIVAVRERIPAQRFMPDTALANALVYLVHSSSSYVTGETLVVDGGWDMWGRLAAIAS